MKTLKELRNKLHLTQPEVAGKIGCSIPQYSNYEKGKVMPPLEDMIVLERLFTQQINWPDQINAEDKGQILHGIVQLAKHYPLISVLNFVQKSIKQDMKFGSPGRTINFFNQKAKETRNLKCCPD